MEPRGYRTIPRVYLGQLLPIPRGRFRSRTAGIERVYLGHRRSPPGYPSKCPSGAASARGNASILDRRVGLSGPVLHRHHRQQHLDLGSAWILERAQRVPTGSGVPTWRRIGRRRRSRRRCLRARPSALLVFTVVGHADVRSAPVLLGLELLFAKLWIGRAGLAVPETLPLPLAGPRRAESLLPGLETRISGALTMAALTDEPVRCLHAPSTGGHDGVGPHQQTYPVPGQALVEGGMSRAAREEEKEEGKKSWLRAREQKEENA